MVDQLCETPDIQEQQRFDTTARQKYMKETIPDFSGDLEIRQFTFAPSNPTLVLSDNTRRYVLRKKPPGKRLWLSAMPLSIQTNYCRQGGADFRIQH